MAHTVWAKIYGIVYIVHIICPICISFNGKPIIKLNPFLLYCQLLDLASFPEQYSPNRSDEPNSHCDLFRSVLISLTEFIILSLSQKISDRIFVVTYMHNYSQ